RSILMTERAIADLRNGFPVICKLKAYKKTIIFFATENLSERNLKSLSNQGWYLSLTAKRLAYLDKSSQSAGRIAIDNLSIAEINS
ncbi:hypothetical protein, partial [Pseudomonas marginalis]|uniref:hypothetical protein n=1 Tax=Pseudomonas marginalis TaxID=298 RepID=UPI0034D4ECD8